jgi:TM2 domain-containing membrane protein YozV
MEVFIVVSICCGLLLLAHFATPSDKKEQTTPQVISFLPPQSVASCIEKDKVSSTNDNDPNTKCPYCGEVILKEAKKCRFCQEYLDANLRYQMTVPKKSRGTYIILGILLGGLGIHNFYAGRYGSGVCQLIITLTLVWFVVGIVINALWILCELLAVEKDGNGNVMV